MATPSWLKQRDDDADATRLRKAGYQNIVQDETGTAAFIPRTPKGESAPLTGGVLREPDMTRTPKSAPTLTGAVAREDTARIRPPRRPQGRLPAIQPKQDSIDKPEAFPGADAMRDYSAIQPAQPEAFPGADAMRDYSAIQPAQDFENPDPMSATEPFAVNPTHAAGLDRGELAQDVADDHASKKPDLTPSQFAMQGGQPQDYAAMQARLHSLPREAGQPVPPPEPGGFDWSMGNIVDVARRGLEARKNYQQVMPLGFGPGPGSLGAGVGSTAARAATALPKTSIGPARIATALEAPGVTQSMRAPAAVAETVPGQLAKPLNTAQFPRFGEASGISGAKGVVTPSAATSPLRGGSFRGGGLDRFRVAGPVAAAGLASGLALSPGVDAHLGGAQAQAALPSQSAPFATQNPTAVPGPEHLQPVGVEEIETLKPLIQAAGFSQRDYAAGFALADNIDLDTATPEQYEKYMIEAAQYFDAIPPAGPLSGDVRPSQFGGLQGAAEGLDKMLRGR